MKSLAELLGIGEAVAEKLKSAGYTSLVEIAVASPHAIADIAEIGLQSAIKIVGTARKEADIGAFETGETLLERRKKIAKLTTSSKAFDNLMGGGIETQAITELFGEFGSGKTQIAHQLAVNNFLPEEMGGFDAQALFIDTENTFRPERICSMAGALDLEPKEVLKAIHVARAFNSDHQMFLVEKANEIAKEKKIKLLIVDSLTSHFRAEYVGRNVLADRQGKLNIHLHELMKFAILHNAAVVVTNQVLARPDVIYGDAIRPVGGHVVAHTATFRIYLRKAKGEKRICRLVDSPHLPEAEAIINISEEGVRD
ncbi:MAG: DNA repair and recombination protein RadA [Candidatus Thermoplasmatota archaeon]